MRLRDRNRLPPGGWVYRELAINWTMPKEGRTAPIKLAAGMLSTARSNNPTAGLNPALSVCEDDIDAATCVRLGNDPAWVADGPEQIVIEQRIVAARKCRSCGGRR